MHAACSTLKTSMPLATARAASSLMWPISKLSGCLSSEQNIIWCDQSCSKSDSASKLRAALPSRIWIFIPCFSLPKASSAVKHSWSVLMPASMYCLAWSPIKPGACPSIGLPRFCEAAILASTISSEKSTPGQFIISARYFMRLSCKSLSTSSTFISAPAVSKVVAGTHEGAPKLNLKGTCSPFSIM